jgi:hypothetical protein
MKKGILLMAVLIFAGAQVFAEEPEKLFEKGASIYGDMHKIYVVGEKEDEVTIAPGEFLAFHGTDYNSRFFNPDAMGYDMTIEGSAAAKAFIHRTVPWGVQEKKSGTWLLMGVCAMSEGDATVTLEKKSDNSKRVIKVKVKAYPPGWMKKMLDDADKKKITVNFKKAAWNDVVSELSKVSGMKIQMDLSYPETPENKATYSAKNKPLTEVLDKVSAQFGLSWLAACNRILIIDKPRAEMGQVKIMIDGSLEYLARHQSDDGSFSPGTLASLCKLEPKCDKDGTADAAIQTTALALLVFLGDGSTHEVGPFKVVVRKAMRYLFGKINGDGYFEEMKGGLPLCDSIFGTWAISEFYAITKYETAKSKAEAALAFVLSAQNTDGGWGWAANDGKSNSMATCFAVLALKAAKTGGLNVPAGAFEKAGKYFSSVTDDKGTTGYDAIGGGAFEIPGVGKFDDFNETTAASCIGRIFCSVKRSEPAMTASLKNVLMNSIPGSKKDPSAKPDFMYAYLGTYSVFQFGNENWEKWYPSVTSALFKAIRADGCMNGSFDPDDRWCKSGGRLYATALNTLTLEIIARYHRVKGPMLKYEKQPEKK